MKRPSGVTCRVAAVVLVLFMAGAPGPWALPRRCAGRAVRKHGGVCRGVDGGQVTT